MRPKKKMLSIADGSNVTGAWLFLIAVATLAVVALLDRWGCRDEPNGASAVWGVTDTATAFAADALAPRELFNLHARSTFGYSVRRAASRQVTGGPRDGDVEP